MFQEFQREFSIKEEQQPLKKTSKMITFGFGNIQNETIQIHIVRVSIIIYPWNMCISVPVSVSV